MTKCSFIERLLVRVTFLYKAAHPFVSGRISGEDAQMAPVQGGRLIRLPLLET